MWMVVVWCTTLKTPSNLIWPHPFFRMVLSILRGDCQKPLTLVSIGRHIYATLDNSNYNHQESSVRPRLFSNFNDRTGCLQAFQMHFKISSALFAVMMVFATSTAVADICPTSNQRTELKVDQAIVQKFSVKWFKKLINIYFSVLSVENEEFAKWVFWRCRNNLEIESFHCYYSFTTQYSSSSPTVNQSLDH